MGDALSSQILTRSPKFCKLFAFGWSKADLKLNELKIYSWHMNLAVEYVVYVERWSLLPHVALLPPPMPSTTSLCACRNRRRSITPPRYIDHWGCLKCHLSEASCDTLPVSLNCIWGESQSGITWSSALPKSYIRYTTGPLKGREPFSPEAIKAVNTVYQQSWLQHC